MKNNINYKNINAIKSTLKNSISVQKNKVAMFFKTGIGEYAEHDEFIGVSVPILRKIAKDFENISQDELQELITSKINEERLLALLILIKKYDKASDPQKQKFYKFYLNNLSYVNNWNLVDTSAHLILGAHLADSNKDILFSLANSKIMWERRIAIVSTWYFIKKHDLIWTFSIAEILLNDTHDLIHKAVGWMLREAGKRDEQQLILFLDKHQKNMPRTMLRYAIEKFPETMRKNILRQNPDN